MSFEDVMQELQKEYVESLPEKITEIEDNLSTKNVEDLTTSFHRLKGSGKTYGLPEISELGAIAEQICRQQPHCVTSALPDALELLKDIHLERKASRSLNLEEDVRFSRLKSIVN